MSACPSSAPSPTCAPRWRAWQGAGAARGPGPDHGRPARGPPVAGAAWRRAARRPGGGQPLRQPDPVRAPTRTSTPIRATRPRDAALLAGGRLRPAVRAHGRPRCTRRASPPPSPSPASPSRWTARPGRSHFAGVATVVTKLLIQCAARRRRVRREGLPAAAGDPPPGARPRPAGGDRRRARPSAPTDGLALSSRNAYLTAGRARGRPHPQPRAHPRPRPACGRRGRSRRSRRSGSRPLSAAGFGQIDYFEVRDADDLSRLGPGPIDAARPASWPPPGSGKTRLIDNMAV